MIPGVDGDTIHVVSMVDFWMGEWTKGYLVWAQPPHEGNQEGDSPIGACECLGSPTLKMMYEVK